METKSFKRMKTELAQSLFEEFEWTRPFGDLRSTGMWFGFMMGDGWYQIVRELCGGIQDVIDWNPGKFKDFRLMQAKEKFGGLCFYTTHDGDWYVSNLIAVAEWRAKHTCEICGRPGILRAYGWYQTRCDWHEFVARSRRRWWNLLGWRLSNFRFGVRRQFCRWGIHRWRVWSDGAVACDWCPTKKGEGRE